MFSSYTQTCFGYHEQTVWSARCRMKFLVDGENCNISWTSHAFKHKILRMLALETPDYYLGPITITLQTTLQTLAMHWWLLSVSMLTVHEAGGMGTHAGRKPCHARAWLVNCTRLLTMFHPASSTFWRLIWSAAFLCCWWDPPVPHPMSRPLVVGQNVPIKR